MIALFCGSRDWTDRGAIEADMFPIAMADPEALIVHGGARGADDIAGEVARHLGLHVAEVRALWPLFGRGAGPRRNEAMLRLKPDVVYAYPLGGNGTRSMINLSRDAGIEVVVRQPVAVATTRERRDA